MTPEEQLEIWRESNVGHGLYLDDDNKIKSRFAGEVFPCKMCGNPNEDEGTCDSCRNFILRVPFYPIKFCVKAIDLLTKRITGT